MRHLLLCIAGLVCVATVAAHDEGPLTEHRVSHVVLAAQALREKYGSSYKRSSEQPVRAEMDAVVTGAGFADLADYLRVVNRVMNAYLYHQLLEQSRQFSQSQGDSASRQQLIEIYQQLTKVRQEQGAQRDLPAVLAKLSQVSSAFDQPLRKARSGANPHHHH